MDPRLLIATVLLLPVPAGAADHFAGPAGSARGAGTREDPWDLQTALARPEAVRPGDTVWLLAGTYGGPFQCRLRGAEGRPVVLRAEPGRRVTLDAARRGNSDRPEFDVVGDWVDVWGLELTCSDPERRTAVAGSWPPDIRRGGFFCRATGVRIINCVIRDGDNGVGFWSDGAGGEVYGCLIYSNGWDGPDRGHGHAVYAQNKSGTKRIVDNVMFNQFGEGLHAYGSEKASLIGFHVEGNVSFHNGSAGDPGRRTSEMLIGGGCRADGVVVRDNFTYGGVGGGGSVRFGYPGGARDNGAVDLRGNYFCGPVAVSYWDRVTFRGNTVVAPSGLVHLLTAGGVPAAGYDWGGNTYHRTGTMWDDFSAGRGGRLAAAAWPAWRELVGEPGSTYRTDPPSGVKVFVRPNRYEPGRGHVIVYNWDRRGAVQADLSGVLTRGQAFRVVSAQDYFGEPVLEGEYDGSPVTLPMRAYTARPPVGLPDHRPPATGPEFNVFVVLPVRPGGAGPKAP